MFVEDDDLLFDMDDFLFSTEVRLLLIVVYHFNQTFDVCHTDANTITFDVTGLWSFLWVFEIIIGINLMAQWVYVTCIDINHLLDVVYNTRL